MATLTISDRMDEIARSKILAKAIVEKDGKFQIVAIFEKSYEYCFAIVFTARSKRSPRKCWKRKVINKRPIAADDAKAWRMIIKKAKGQE